MYIVNPFSDLCTMILPYSFYSRNDVVLIARELIGKVLVSRVNGITTSGIIYETEAYNGIVDSASHAFGGRRTARTEIMYSDGGTAYIYLCYGVHSLFNVVTNRKDIPHAVLIRAIKPLDNSDIMLERTGKPKLTKNIGDGPGKVAALLGIHFSQTGRSLLRKPANNSRNGLWIEDRGILVDPSEIWSGPRIGVEYAGKDAMLPYRFRTEMQ
ncbi:MAG: DNA-3-methyladenine glycosylase [Bacteroidetes bacterium]|nr:DNA-3-methyladenine glycosylase [Bacteroidota bacterium]